MLFLPASESGDWTRFAREVIDAGALPGDFADRIRRDLLPVFHFHVGSLLAGRGRNDESKRWFQEGALSEPDGNFVNAFVRAFLERHDGRLRPPSTAFADPRPYVHFTTLPLMKQARASFARACSLSLPDFRKPVTVWDLGCGDGGGIVRLLGHLREQGRVREIGEVVLLDSSPAMLELALTTVGQAFPGTRLTPIRARFQDASDKMPGRADLAVASLSIHHMPVEDKCVHLKRIADQIDHFVLFEFDANHDTPEHESPELAVSVYQSYGPMVDAVFAHDAPVAVAQSCVDNFWMAELISFLTQPRGVRTDYHMLRRQWHSLFEEALGSRFSCLSESTAWTVGGVDLVTLHYGS